MWPKFRLLRSPMAREGRRKPLPCSLCGFCAKTATDSHGYVCLWYGVYLALDDARSGRNDLRQACIRDGNHFIFRLKGVGPTEMLDYRMKHSDWARTRRLALLGGAIGVMSLVLSLAGLWLHSQ